MAKSKVFMADFRASLSENLPQKLERLLKTAGFDGIDMDGKFVALKIHFGEPGNLAFIRPQYARVIVDCVKKRGGKPFLTDCNTLYVGGRKNGLDHLESAARNGFVPYCTGCHVVIADGIKGTDDVEVPVEGGRYVKSAKIGRAVMDADVFISVTHFKGHENTGIGGVLKNIGMGCGSRAGKLEMHSNGKPFFDAEKCCGCGSCKKVCGSEAISIENRKARIDYEKCAGCGRCIGVCPKDAMAGKYDEKNDILNEKIAEYTKAVVAGRPCFHVSFVMDVSPNCDCHSENDAPIVPNIGIFASFDPVALDAACADAVLRAPALRGTSLDEADRKWRDPFKDLHPVTQWQVQISAGERLGLGTGDYELVKI